MKKSFAQKIEALRGNKTQKEFARQLGVPLNTYTNWTREITKPTCDAIITACTVLGVSSDWLLGIKDDEKELMPTKRLTPDATSGTTESYWRDLVASQQATIARLTGLLVEGRTETATPVKTGGHTATKTA